jgi:hypothetical protein
LKTLNKNTIRKQYLRLAKKIEEKYVEAMEQAIRAQYGPVIDALKDRGIVAARQVAGHLVYNIRVTRELEKLFKFTIRELGLRQIKLILRQITRSEGRAFGIYKDTAAFGLDAGWNQAIIDFLNQYLLKRAVVPVTNTTKEYILEVLNRGQQEGWGLERIINELQQQSDELSPFRARRIVRTEIGIAGNFANKLAADSIPFEVVKVWISSHDHRVRDSHRKMDLVEVDENLSFHVPVIKKRQQVGIDLMSGPGDPEGSAGNVINCRCTLAFNPKRDEKGKLIKKPITRLAA